MTFANDPPTPANAPSICSRSFGAVGAVGGLLGAVA
jgi:hypothetical protein